MSTERIIHSNLDTDTYKISMGQAVFHNYPDTQAGFRFTNRGKTQFPQGFDKKLREQVEMLSELRLSRQEKAFLGEKCPFVTQDYLDWFSDYSYDPGEIKVTQDGGDLSVEIEGEWKRAIYWEVPLMAMISELYFTETGQEPNNVYLEQARRKAEMMASHGISFADFGTRRRFSRQVHSQVVQILKKFGGTSFVGTSNVWLAMKYNLAPIGTFAHEWVMGHAGLYGVSKANRKAMEVWVEEFDGKLSTALTDTYTTGSFLKDFNGDLAKVYKGMRQDSGSPEAWSDQVITHLKENLGLDPREFTAVYSDSLNPQRTIEIQNHLAGRMKAMFGIGTNLTNDVGVKPLNIVIKMHYIVNFSGEKTPVVKVSDDPGKSSAGHEVVRSVLQPLAA